MFLDVADSHAPLKKKRVKGISSPWITPELKRLMLQRDKLKKLASGFPTDGNWTSYKHTKNKVNYEIKNVKMNYGLDNISARLLKEASPIVTRSLTFIINQSITTGIFPNAWKRARVSPIFKEDLRTDPNNYRPISVLPVVSKLI